MQQDVERGSQPWYYYFLVIPLYEQATVVFGLAGLVVYFLGRRSRRTVLSGAAFVVFTLLTLFVGPNLLNVLHVTLVLLMVVSGLALLVVQPRTPVLNLLLWWIVLTWGIYTYAGEKMPWLTLHLLLPTMVVAALYAGRLLQAPRLSRRWVVTVVLLAVTMLISFRSAVALAYADGANPTEMLVYTQTAPDVPAVSAMLHHIPLQPLVTGTRSTLKARVWVDGADAWPWVWYLHDDPSPHGWNGTAGDVADASTAAIAAAQQRFPVLLVGSEDHDYMLATAKLSAFAGYTGYEFKLRWWFPEDGYKGWETTGLGGFLQDALRPASWGQLWDWWATRTPFDPAAFKSWANVYPFYVYVRSDLIRRYVPATWSSAQRKALADSIYTPPAQPEDVPRSIVRPAVATLVVHARALAHPMAAVRAVAVDAAGNIYLADSTAQQVVKLNRFGRYVTSWGSTGQGPGQFANLYPDSNPLGLAVDGHGHVYVSDTWNGHVQEFTANGAFMRSFGRPNPTAGSPSASSFYGPRQLAVAPNGNIYVADTGNKRIQVYSPQGVHLFNIGDGSASNPSARGHFDEPSGIAIDRRGIVYVADFWNRRIQRFTLAGRLLGSFTVAGWVPGTANEPYLAVDKAGHLFASDAPGPQNPHVAHVLEFNATTGALLRAYGTAGTGHGTLVGPSGLAVGPDGDLYIADAGTAELLKIWAR